MIIICNSYQECLKTLIQLEDENLYSFGRFCLDYEVDNFPAYYYNHDINSKMDGFILNKTINITSGYRFNLIKDSDITSDFLITGKNITRIQIYTNNKCSILYDKVYDKESNVNLHFPLFNVACYLSDVVINVEAESLFSFKSLNYILSNEDRKHIAITKSHNRRVAYSHGVVENVKIRNNLY